MSNKLNPKTGLKFERIKITWPTIGSFFTVEELFNLNKDETGKPKLSKVSIQAKINAQLDMGNVVVGDTIKTKGRPKISYKVIKDTSTFPLDEMDIPPLKPDAFNI